MYSDTQQESLLVVTTIRYTEYYTRGSGKTEGEMYSVYSTRELSSYSNYHKVYRILYTG